DGSGKAAGLKVYVDGVAREVDTQSDNLKDTIRTQAPLTFAQRRGGHRLNDLLLQDVRVYGRALASAEVGHLARGTRSAYLLGKPAKDRTPAEADELFAGWLPGNDQPYRELSGKVDA